MPLHFLSLNPLFPPLPLFCSPQVVDPSKARRPDPGNLVGIGREAGKAKLGSGAKTLLTQHILRTKVRAVCQGSTSREGGGFGPLYDLLIPDHSGGFDSPLKHVISPCLISSVGSPDYLCQLPQGKLNSVDETEDPREALLKHADKVDVFSAFTNAYKDTQPKPIFAEEEKEEEDE